MFFLLSVIMSLLLSPLVLINHNNEQCHCNNTMANVRILLSQGPLYFLFLFLKESQGHLLCEKKGFCLYFFKYLIQYLYFETIKHCVLFWNYFLKTSFNVTRFTFKFLKLLESFEFFWKFKWNSTLHKSQFC